MGQKFWFYLFDLVVYPEVYYLEAACFARVELRTWVVTVRENGLK